MKLLNSKKYRLDWLSLYQPDRGRRSSFSDAIDKVTGTNDKGSGLYYACFTRLEAIVPELLGVGADINAQGGELGNALQAASYNGLEKVVEC